ncbi:MAG: HAD family hydrolase, partial [bacterium]
MPKLSDSSGPRGLIFDFDGLILDTEWPEYLSWQKAFEDRGLVLELSEWTKVVGRPELLDFHQVLERRLGRPVDKEALGKERLKLHRELSEGLVPLPGIRELMVEGAAKGWRIGVASNSTRDWVFRNLRKHGLDAWIETIRTRDN